MPVPGKSRWDSAGDGTDSAGDAQRRRDKDERRRAKVERRRRVEEAALPSPAAAAAAAAAVPPPPLASTSTSTVKKIRFSPAKGDAGGPLDPAQSRLSLMKSCRHLGHFEILNAIEEGSYGWVSRAHESATGEIVALKKFKMDVAAAGIPITVLREIQTLKAARHEHVVNLREIVVGDTLNDLYMVMDFVEHDLKTLQEDMPEPFLPSEVKTLLQQLVSAVDFLHDQWILHILMNNRGQLKIADFGMARYYSVPPDPDLTRLVVTLWYRAPELLLGTHTYDHAVDVWSIGCIFGELIMKKPLLQGTNEVSQLTKIFELCGVPTEADWPGFRRLPNAKSLRLPRTSAATGAVIRAKFPFLTKAGTDLLSSLLSLDPEKRPNSSEILSYPYFSENPRPKAASMFPTFPSKAGQEKRRKYASPSAPKRGEAPKFDENSVDFSGIFAGRELEEAGAGFQLRLI